MSLIVKIDSRIIVYVIIYNLDWEYESFIAASSARDSQAALISHQSRGSSQEMEETGR